MTLHAGELAAWTMERAAALADGRAANVDEAAAIADACIAARRRALRRALRSPLTRE